MPDVRGMKPGEAVARLRAAGFKARIGAPVESRRFPKGTVAGLSPASAEPGDTITLYVSKGAGRGPGGQRRGGGPPVTPTPDPGGPPQQAPA
ncbi:PASTA domain-containing protein [Actinomadura luteofluorescens]|uniref:PASTA domain-containing protein n=1 Tax=Actinomadura luteofluorescens TaxID=46163 RepID=UPI003644C7B5